MYVLACSCRYPSTVSFCGQAAQLHDGVRSGVLIDVRLQFAVRSEAHFEGRLEHQRQPKLPKKSPGSKQDSQKSVPGIGRTAHKMPGRPKGKAQRGPGQPKGSPGSKQDGPKGAQGAGRTGQKARQKTKRSSVGAIWGAKSRLRCIFAKVRFTSALPMRQTLQNPPDAPQSGPETSKGRPESRQDGQKGAQQVRQHGLAGPKDAQQARQHSLAGPRGAQKARWEFREFRKAGSLGRFAEHLDRLCRKT